MRKKIIAIIAILVAFSMAIGTSSALSVGVKKGDSVTYAISYTGTPPAGYDATSWSMDITNVSGPEITVNLTTAIPNSPAYTSSHVFNLQNGTLGPDDWIIPAGLKTGETFFDANVGNVTIQGTETRTYVGVARTVLVYSSGHSTSYWDQETGVIMEGVLTYPEYTMTNKVEQTNLWQTQTALDQTLIIILAVVAIVIVAVVAVVLGLKRRK
jgi:hypothetical protein